MPLSRSTVDIWNADANQILYKSVQIDPGVAQSGSLPTQVFATGVGAQASTTRTVTAYVVVTGTSAASTCTIALSPDNSTYSNVATITPTITATVLTATIIIPAGWFMKCTFSNATITTTLA